ncbi:MAG: hypothetical protein WD314_04185 [Trueperaceae bacterium]
MGHRRVSGDQVHLDGAAALSDTHAGLNESTAAEPSVELTPEQVVEAVLAACRVSAGEAAAVLWAFGSGRLRRSAGAPEHLIRHLGNELFRPLLEATETSCAPMERLDDAARQIVTVRAARGDRVPFLFALARSDAGDQPGCWLVSGLERA